MDNEFKIDPKKVLKVIIILILSTFVIFVVFKLSYYFLPFIIAFAISSMLEPIIRLIIKNTKLSRKYATPIALMLVAIPLGTAITLLITGLISQIKSFSKIAPQYFRQFYEATDKLISESTKVYSWLPSEVTDYLSQSISNLSETLLNILNVVVGKTLNTLISIPEVFIFVSIVILSTYFLSSDRDKILVFFKYHLPERWTNKLLSIKNDVFLALFGYIRAQLIMMCITFIELYLGLAIIGARYALLIAFITALLDALPILGSGTVLIPWGIYHLFGADFKFGISLIALYIIIFVVRQFIEPKILSQQIGVYPLVTLLAIYVGLRIFGFLGLILGPITVLVIKNIIRGILKGRPAKELFNYIKRESK